MQPLVLKCVVAATCGRKQKLRPTICMEVLTWERRWRPFWQHQGLFSQGFVCFKCTFSERFGMRKDGLFLWSWRQTQLPANTQREFCLFKCSGAFLPWIPTKSIVEYWLIMCFILKNWGETAIRQHCDAYLLLLFLKNLRVVLANCWNYKML